LEDVDKLEEKYSENMTDFLINQNVEFGKKLKNHEGTVFKKKLEEGEIIEMLRLNIHMLINKLRFDDRTELLGNLSDWLLNHETDVLENPLSSLGYNSSALVQSKELVKDLNVNIKPNAPDQLSVMNDEFEKEFEHFLTNDFSDETDVYILFIY
jgi:hypothetical protein